jgi:hypothetical protein
MKPLNIDKTGCSNISSNCVTWQGPDIECIGLCKGDSVTEVVYKLAVELCALMDTFDLTNYDLSCFSTGVCQPQTFKDFINILINKVCALQTCNPNCGDSCNPCLPNVQNAAIQTSTTTDPYVPISKEFQFTSQTGDDVTMLKVSDYAQAIGNKVSGLVNSASILQSTLSNHSKRLEALEKQGPPTFEMPTVTPVGVLPKEATSMQLVLAATEQQFSELKAAVGDSNSVYANLQKIDSGINDLKSLSIPGTNMSGLRGFTANPINLADVLGNVLIMLSDMRIAYNNVINNYIPNDCESISLTLFSAIRNSQLIVYVNGTLPASNFINTKGVATKFTLADAHGGSADYLIDIFTIINHPDGYIIDLGNSRLVLSDNLILSANPSFTHKTSGSTCASYLTYTVVNQGSCPSISFIPKENGISYTLMSGPGTQSYTVEVWDSTATVKILSQTILSTFPKAITGEFEDLSSRTLYKIKIKISINNVETPCPYTSVTTI